MWVGGGGTPVAEEARCIRSCCLYFFAVHADRHSLRNGISLIINTAGSKVKIGNEKKLQVAWQNFPTRPQGIYILGTNVFTRIAVNALISFASLFAKNKVSVGFGWRLKCSAGNSQSRSHFVPPPIPLHRQVIARIKFSTLDNIRAKYGAASLPQVHGGAPKKPTQQWVNERLAAFPRMDLPGLTTNEPPRTDLI